VPFVCIQVIMIGLTIMFPQMVMHYKGEVVDPGGVEIVVPPFGGGQLGLPPIGGEPPADGAAPAAPPAGDLSQPPSFN
jgi:hypothetical protein